FDSKDRLFRATFDFLAAEYQEVWDRNLAAAGMAPAARGAAMIESYFDRRVFTGDKRAVWFTFWSDAALRDRYRAAATRIERRYIAAVETEIRRLVAGRDGAPAEAKPVTAAVSAMVDGYWLQAMIYPRRFDRKAAVTPSLAFLKLRLPGVFPKPGPLPRGRRPVSLAKPHPI